MIFRIFLRKSWVCIFRQVAHQLFSDFSIAASGKVAKHLGLVKLLHNYTLNLIICCIKQFDLEPEIALTAVVEMITSFLCHVLDPNQNCRMCGVPLTSPPLNKIINLGTTLRICSGKLQTTQNFQTLSLKERT